MEAKDCQGVHGWTSLQKSFLAALLVAVFLFQIALMREGHDWGGDFAQYLNHARNLATQQPYADTGYVYNPDAAVIGPRAYPPVFPLFLAPIYAAFGLNFIALRVAMISLFVLTIMVSTLLFARRLSPWACLSYAGLLGFCPIFWDFQQTIISEHLFILWWMLTFYVYQRYRGNPEKSSEHYGPAIVTGLLIYLAVGTRTVSIVLPPALLLTEVIAYRRLTRYAMVSIMSAIVFYAIQKLLFPIGGSGYLDQLSEINLHTIAVNLFADSTSFLFFWKNGYSKWFAAAIGLVLSIAAVTGYVKESWPRPQLLAIASAFYFALIVLWPGANGIRMTLPLLPGFLFWILYAVENYSPSPGWRKLGLGIFVVLTLACYAGKYHVSQYGPISGPESLAAQELFEQIASEVKREEVCLFFKPRVLAFYTQRNSVGYPIDLNAESLDRTIETAQVEVVITQNQQLPELEDLLKQVGLEVDWSNADFQLWRKKAVP